MDKNDLMQIAYDAESDVLYVSVGEPRRAITREMSEDVLLRIDPESGAVVGITILHLSTRSNLESLPVQIDLQAIAE